MSKEKRNVRINTKPNRDKQTGTVFFLK